MDKPSMDKRPVVKETDAAREEKLEASAQRNNLESVDFKSSQNRADSALKTRGNRRASGFKLILTLTASVFFSAALCIAVVFATAVTVAKEAASPESVQRMVQGIDLNKLAIGELIKAEDPSETLPEWIYQNLGGFITRGLNISVKDLEAFLAISSFKPILTEKINAFIEDIYNNTGEGKVTNDDVIQFLKDNEKPIAEIIKYQLTDMEYSVLSTYLDRTKPFESWTLVRLVDPARLKAVRLSVSSEALIALCAASALLAALLFALNWRIGKTAAFTWIGFSLLLGGLAFLASSAAMSTAASKMLYVYLLSHIRPLLISRGVILLGAGSILFAIGTLAPRIVKKR
jgi:hypothetical protein